MDRPVWDESMGDENVLAYIEEGMEVFDLDDIKIGTVETVFYGSMGAESMAGTIGEGKGPATGEPVKDPTEGTLIGDIAGALTFDEGLPETVRNRMEREGYIHVSGSGLFGGNLYVLPDQVASISDQGVMLRAKRDALIHR